MPPATSARARGTAWATSPSTITGMTGASCMTCRAVRFTAMHRLLVPPQRRFGESPRTARGPCRCGWPRAVLGHGRRLALRPFVRGHQRLQRAGHGIQADDVAVMHASQRATRRGFGRHMDGRGTLPDAPLMRPSVTSATLKPRPCSTASGGVSLCSSGMPLACGPCQRTTHTTSRSSSPALKAPCSASCESNTRAGASITWRSSGTADTLITLRPRLPSSSFSPPVALNGADAGRTMDSSRDTPLSRQTSAAPSMAGSRV
jgi:hypothetical protein